mgnify:CR=1 FL=1
MIKSFAITPPVLGRISIGHLAENAQGKRLPKKDDQFTLTSQVQTREGWVLHPMDQVLRQQQPDQKLRAIPVRVLFNDPDLSLRAEYTLFDRQTARPICTGDGQECHRLGKDGLQTLPCPGPSLCEFGKGGLCKVYGRLNVSVNTEQDTDALGSFIFRTTGYNSIRTLAARLRYFQAVSGDILPCMDLVLRLRGKSTTQSYRTPIFYVDLTLPDGVNLEDAIVQAKVRHESRLEVGFDQGALDEAARAGFANALFEETEDDVQALLEEFNPEGQGTLPSSPLQPQEVGDTVPNQPLKDKLANRIPATH